MIRRLFRSTPLPVLYAALAGFCLALWHAFRPLVLGQSGAASTYMDDTAANAILKELYGGQVVQDTVYKNNPFLALVPKATDFGGKYYPIPIIIGASQGRSATFTNAQGNQTAAQLAEWLLTSKNDYSIATIQNRTMLAAATDKMSFLRTAKVAMDGAMRAIELSLASALFRSGTGSIGKIAAAGITSGVITLTNAADVTQFEVNMTLQANATDGGASPRAALGYVIARSRSAGTITVASSGLGGTAASPSLWAAGDFLLVQGDNNNKISGIPAWCPVTAPASGDNFYGVDRSADTWRLGGGRYDGSSQSIEEALVDAAAQANSESAKIDTAFSTFTSFAAMEKSLGSKKQYVDIKGPGVIGFTGIQLMGSAGPITVVPDRNQIAAQCILQQLDTWKLVTLGEAPMILRYGDGLDMLRVYNADASEARFAYYGNLSCNAPGWNVNVTLGV